MDNIWVGFVWNPIAFATDDGYEGAWEADVFFETFEEADAWQKAKTIDRRKIEPVHRAQR